MIITKLSLQNNIMYVLTICVVFYCIITNSLTIAAIYGLLVTVYFHIQIIYKKLTLKQYLIMNSLLFVIFMLISFLCTLVFKSYTSDIVMVSLGSQTLLVASSVYYKRHVH